VAQLAAKNEIGEAGRCYLIKGLWLGISRSHAAWHPWDAQHAFHKVVSRHRVLIRSVYLQYSMRGLRIPEKAFRISFAQGLRFIQDCKLSNEAIQSAASSVEAVADTKELHAFLVRIREALMASTAEIKHRATRSGWDCSSAVSSRGSDLGLSLDDGNSDLAEGGGDNDETKTVGLAEFLELITRIALVLYRDREGDTSMNHPADCLDAFIQDKFGELSVSDEGGRSLLEIRGGTRPAKRTPGPFEEDEEKSLEVLGKYTKRLRALYDSVVTRKGVKAKRAKTPAQMTIADFMRTITAAKVLGEQLTAAAVCLIYILSNREEVHNFINFSPASDFGLMEMNFDEFSNALVALAIKKFHEEKKGSVFHFHKVLDALIEDILAAHQLASVHG